MTSVQSKSTTGTAVKGAVEELTKTFDADVLAFSGNLFSPDDARVIRTLRKRKNKRKNLLLVLTTLGGMPDAAYRIAHGIQRMYRTREADGPGQFIIYVPHYCKSAGTILALGADRLVMADVAELGPIDVQLPKDEEVGDWTSGLNAIVALTNLQGQATSLFGACFAELREKGFPTRMASEAAASITIGLLQPIYSQVDPMRLGEITRFVRISVDYGERLQSANVKPKTVDKLVNGYPSHGFIIDGEEAADLFYNVEAPSEALELVGERCLREAWDQRVLSPDRRAIIELLNEERKSGTRTEASQGDVQSQSQPRGARATRTRSPGRKAAAHMGRRSNGAAERPV